MSFVRMPSLGGGDAPCLRVSGIGHLTFREPDKPRFAKKTGLKVSLFVTWRGGRGGLRASESLALVLFTLLLTLGVEAPLHKESLFGGCEENVPPTRTLLAKEGTAPF